MFDRLAATIRILLQRLLVVWLVLISLLAFGWPAWFGAGFDPFVRSKPWLDGIIATTMLAIERQTETPVSKEYVSLDLSRVGRGDFRLSIRVRDLNSGEDLERTMDLTLH